MENRDLRIDLMRVIGTFMVIFAHMEVPVLLQNIRTFDVTMLVFISGMSFALSYKKDLTFGEYLRKRINKLLIPTYYLLIFLFIISYIACFILKRSQLFSIELIVHSFLFLNDGLGYIWIVRVYIFIAMFLFLTIRIFDSHKSLNQILFFILVIFIFWLSGNTSIYGKNVILDSYIMDVIPYCFVAFIGMVYAREKKGINIILILSACIFFIIQILNIFSSVGFCPDNYKYPATVYYLSYGIMITAFFIKFLPNKSNIIIQWYSRNSFLLYLSHILFLFGLNLISEVFAYSFLEIWWIKYLIIMISSTFLCILLNKIKMEVKKWI